MAVIQARVYSERLPRKIFENLEGYPILGVIILNLKRVEQIDEVWVATTEPGAEEVIAVSQEFGAKVFVGDSQDVLSRYVHISKKTGASVIVRSTADNPFVDYKLLKKTIEYHNDHEADVCAFLGRPLGTGVETISASTLIESYTKILNLETEGNGCHREHVSTYLKQNKTKYKILHKRWPEKLDFPENLRLTIDEREDLRLARIIARDLKERGAWPYFSLEDILGIINEKPDLAKINSHISQRPWHHNGK